LRRHRLCDARSRRRYPDEHPAPQEADAELTTVDCMLNCMPIFQEKPMQFRTLDAVRGWTITLPVVSCLALLLALAGCSSTPVAPSSSSTSPQPAAKSSGTAYPALPPAGSGRGGYYLDDGPGDAIPAGLMDVPDADPRI